MVERYFNSTQVLGVAVYDDPPEDVVLSFRRKEGLHFQAQPFYPFRQEDILVDTQDKFRVRLSIIINKELVSELARLGNSVNVLHPPKLMDDLIEFHQSALLHYSC